MGASRNDLSLYEVLEVDQRATQEEINTSYERLLEHLGSDDIALYSILEEGEAERLRGQLDEAYRTLGDPERRAAYDRRVADDDYPNVVVPSSDSYHADVSYGHVPSAARGRDGRAGGLTDVLWNSGDSAGYAGAARPFESADRHQQPDRGGGTADGSYAPASESSDRQSETCAPDSGESLGRASRSRGSLSAPSDSEARVDGRLDQASDGQEKPRRVVPASEIVLDADTEYSGALLRRLRESADASLHDIAELTKIGKHYLSAIEDNDFDSLPAPVYVRGFVSEYARVLGLDPKVVAKSFMALYNRYRDGGKKG